MTGSVNLGSNGSGDSHGRHLLLRHRRWHGGVVGFRFGNFSNFKSHLHQ